MNKTQHVDFTRMKKPTIQIQRVTPSISPPRRSPSDVALTQSSTRCARAHPPAPPPCTWAREIVRELSDEDTQQKSRFRTCSVTLFFCGCHRPRCCQLRTVCVGACVLNLQTKNALEEVFRDLLREHWVCVLGEGVVYYQWFPRLADNQKSLSSLQKYRFLSLVSGDSQPKGRG